MDNLKNEVLSKPNKSYCGLFCLLALLLCVCEEIPEHCGDKYPALNPSTEFCHQGKPVSKCGGAAYNPSAQFCYQNKPVTRCGGTAEYNPSTQGCYDGVVRNDANVLTVKIEPTNGGMVSFSPDQATYKWGTTVTVTATAASGYKFKGWASEAASGEAADTARTVKITMDGNKTLWANFDKGDEEQSTYTVNFNANGATGAAPEAIQRNYGGVIILPNQAGLTKDGYSFAGWNLNSGGTGTGYAAGSSYTVTGNVTLYAKWSRATYTLKTDVSPSNGGTVSRSPNKETYQDGEEVTVTATAASGYIFKGWSGASSSTNAAITITMNEDKTLTAGFGAPNAKRFTVYFNANGGGSAPNEASADSGASITLPGQQTMEKSGGYRFNGWNLKSDGTGTNYAANASYKVTGNVTLYAKWVRVYTVTYNGNGTSVGVPNAVNNVDSGATVTLSGQGNMTRTGYEFNGWNTSANGSGTGYAANYSYRITGDVTLYALWTATTYSITYTLNNGTVSSANPTSYTVETATFTLNNPNRSGYTFTGWTGSNITTAQTSVTIEMGSTGNRSYTANWQQNAVTYAVTVTGGTGSGSYAAGTTVNISAGAAPTGQQFKNWTSSGVAIANPNNAINSFIMPSNAVTITAVFEAIYTVTVTGGTGSGSYAAGTTVSISAGTAPVGQAFDKWTTSNSGVSFANANNAATTFTMPSNAVTVTAIWKQVFTDGRDNKTYKKVVIGGKTWMAENLNYVTSSGSWCYNNNADSCVKYGRLYTWDIAKTACPLGWHLPSREEWGALAIAAGGTGTYGAGSGTAGKALKSQTGWNFYSGVWNDDTYEFSALPGGSRGSDGTFDYVGNYGYWWTATEESTSSASGRLMYYIDYIVPLIIDAKSNGFSVRCVEGAASLYAVTVSGGSGATGTGSYTAGTMVSINAGTAPAGQVFKNWTVTSGGVTLGNANSAATTFVMLSNAVTVTANFVAATFTDSRDSKTYKQLVIGGKTWMAENLNIEMANSWCYNNSPDSCAKYGRLYRWEVAMTACPSGWHLPSREEWGALVTAAGGSSVAGKALKSTDGWYNNGNGTDDFGFSALPCGIRWSNGSFSDAGSRGFWWTATEYSGGDAYYRYIDYSNGNVNEFYTDKSYGFSVRCVSD